MDANSGGNIRFLQAVLVAGGVYEILMGLVMIFLIKAFFPLLGAEREIAYMIYPRSMGVLAVSFGALMLAAASDPQRYVVIPLVSIGLRVAIQFPIALGCIETPSMTLPLIGFGAFDLAFAVLTAAAIWKSGIEWRRW